MKTFDQYREDSKIARNVEYREKGGTTTPNIDPKLKNHEVVGWFTNKHNRAAGWAFYKLDNADRSWLKSQGVNLAGVFRTNGDVLKAAGWKAPAKGARGNIFDESNGLTRMSAYGPAYNK